MDNTKFRSAITERTIHLVKRILYPWEAEGILSRNEYNEIMLNLKYLSRKGTLYPVVVPKLVNQPEAAEMLSISLANFKKLEREGHFPFHRKMVGSSVRYRNLDIIKFIMEDEDAQGVDKDLEMRDEYDFSEGEKKPRSIKTDK